jgi:hypothetical protein
LNCTRDNIYIIKQRVWYEHIISDTYNHTINIFYYPVLAERQNETVTLLVLTSQMVPIKRFELTPVSIICRQFGSCFHLLILQDKYNIHTFSLNKNIICILRNRQVKLVFLSLQANKTEDHTLKSIIFFLTLNNTIHVRL